MARHGRWLVVVALLALSVAGAPTQAVNASCGLQGAAQSRAVRSAVLTAPVVVYGDSITAQSHLLLPHGWGYDARWGRTTRATLERLRADLAARRHHLPRTVVMAVGTNDRRHPGAMPSLVVQTRALLPARVRLVWVDVYVERRPGWREVDAAITTSVPGVQVVDWVRPNLAALDRTGRSALLAPDGIHLSCRGGRVRTALLVRAVARPDPAPG